MDWGRLAVRALYWICAAGAILTFDYFVRKNDRLPYPDEPSLEKISDDFHEAIAAIDGRPRCEVRKFHRARATGIGQTFSLNVPLSLSMTQVKHRMSMNGWNLVDEHERHGKTDYVRFCRNRISAIFDARNGYGREGLYVGVAWASYREHRNYCSQDTKVTSK